MKTPKRDLFTPGLLALMFGYGLTVTMIAPLVSYIIDDFSLTTAQGGLVTTALSIGGLCAVLFTLWSDRISKASAHRAGYLIFSAALLLTAAAKSYILLLALIFIAGFGSKIVDTLANPILADRYPDASSKTLSLMHMTLSIGACAGPLILPLLLGVGASWQAAFAAIGALCLILWIASLFLMGKNTAPAVHTQSDNAGNSNLRGGLGVIIPLCLCTFFYQGHQTIVNTWAAMYCENALALGEFAANLSTVALWIGIILSRLISAKFVRPEMTVKISIWGDAVGGIIMLLGVLSGNAVLVMLTLVIAGLLSGAVIPLIVAHLCRLYPRSSGLVTSFVFFTLVAAPMVIPPLAGSLADAAGFTSVMAVSAGMLILAGISAAFASKRQ